jgi:hypothetical protein
LVIVVSCDLARNALDGCLDAHEQQHQAVDLLAGEQRLAASKHEAMVPAPRPAAQDGRRGRGYCSRRGMVRS